MKIEKIPIDQIKAGKNTRSFIDVAKLAQLAQSIEANGLLQPIGLKKIDGGYELIFGFRRIEAFKLLERKEIDAMIFAEDQSIEELQIIENLQREDISIFDLAEAIRDYKKNSGLRFEEIGQILGKRPEEIAMINRINDLIDSLKKRLKDESLKLDAALYISRYPKEEQSDFAKDKQYYEVINLQRAKDFFDDRHDFTDRFPWPLDQSFNRLPKCTECKDRSSSQSLLFPEMNPEKEKCLNSFCLEKKLQQYIKEQMKLINKDDDLIVFDGDDFTYNYKYSIDHIDKEFHYISNLKAAKKNASGDNTVFGIIVKTNKIQNFGKLIEFDNSLVKADIKKAGISKTKKPIEELSPAKQLQRKIENYQRKKEIILFPKSIMLLNKIRAEFSKLDFKSFAFEEISIDSLAVILDYILDKSNFSLHEQLLKIYNPEKDRNNFFKIYKALCFSAIHVPDNPDPEWYYKSQEFDRLKKMAPALGIDLKGIDADLQKEFDEKLLIHKERFIKRNKIDPEAEDQAGDKKAKKKRGKKA